MKQLRQKAAIVLTSGLDKSETGTPFENQEYVSPIDEYNSTMSNKNQTL
jgi:hypothetical protein